MANHLKRKPMVAGNWKMNANRQEAEILARGVVDKTGWLGDVDVVLCPPYVWLADVARVIGSSRTGLGAQNLFWEDKGAFTGEISAAMLKSAGCKYVIVGHSERRQYFGETDSSVNMRLKKALEIGLSPIVCIGETLTERESGKTGEVIKKQFLGCFEGVADFGNIIIAYEPVWAIGTGRNATPQQAQEVHYLIRQLLSEQTIDFENVRILYGGSAKPENARELFACADIDGFLVGGASLKAADFAAIISAVATR